MSTGKEQLEVDDDLVESDDDGQEAPVEVAKTNLSKRRTIDNLLEERTLAKTAGRLRFRPLISRERPEASLTELFMPIRLAIQPWGGALL